MSTGNQSLYFYNPLTGRRVKKNGKLYQTLILRGQIKPKIPMKLKSKVKIPLKLKLPTQRLSQLVFYHYPLIVNYHSLKETQMDHSMIHIESINQWITDPIVRINLLNNFQLSIIGTYFPPNNGELNQVDVFDSPYFVEYQNYINEILIPIYLREMSEKKIQTNTQIGDRLIVLIKSALGFLPASNDDHLMVLKYLFPLSTIQKQSDIGNCYFDSIGANIKKTGEEIRRDVSNILKSYNQHDYEVIVKSLINNSSFDLSLYMELIQKSSQKGDVDGEDCLWGDSGLDPYLSVFYQKPIISMVIGANDFSTNDPTEFEFNELTEPIQKASTLMDLFGTKKVEKPDEEEQDDWIDEVKTLTISTSEMFLSLHYTIPIQSINLDPILYLNQYEGPFISYLMYTGKVHFDVIDFGQMK
jgi:hypothetical protein